MKNKLTYFIARSSMFGIGFFLLFKNTGKDSWISLILGTLLGIIILFVYKYIKEYFSNHNIKDILSKTFLGKIYLLIFLLFYIYLMSIILILLPMFVKSFYLLYTPKFLIIVPFLFIAVYISFKDKKVLESLSNLLFVLCVSSVILYSLLLLKYVDSTNLYPIFSSNTISILKSAFIYGTITSIPQIITINFHGNTFKDELKEYIFASLINLLMIILIILTLGEPLIKIYSFPEYAVFKQIKILNFIENIENISTFIWYFDMFMMLATLTTNVKNILPYKYNKLYLLAIITLIIYISAYFIANNYRYIITVFYYYPVVLSIFFGIFVTLLIYLKYSSKLKAIKKEMEEKNKEQ